MLILTILAQMPFARSGDDTLETGTLIVPAVQLLSLLGSIIPVEKALKRTFDENGSRR